MEPDTDYTQAVKLENLSPTWIRQLDREYGEAKRKNGGYFSINADFEGGKPRPLRFHLVLEFLPWKRKKNKD